MDEIEITQRDNNLNEQSVNCITSFVISILLKGRPIRSDRSIRLDRVLGDLHPTGVSLLNEGNILGNQGLEKLFRTLRFNGILIAISHP